MIVIGVVFNIIGCIGLIRLPDLYNRLQAATKCVTLGTCTVLAGCMFLSDNTSLTLKCLICLIFILITSPTAAHALARGSYAFGVRLWDKSVVDKYKAVQNKGPKEVDTQLKEQERRHS